MARPKIRAETETGKSKEKSKQTSPRPRLLDFSNLNETESLVHPVSRPRQDQDETLTPYCMARPKFRGKTETEKSSNYFKWTSPRTSLLFFEMIGETETRPGVSE